MSHPLPEQVRLGLQYLFCAVEERLQAETHTVGLAIESNPNAFDNGWVESHLSRAVIAQAAFSVDGGALHRKELPNGGVEITSRDNGIERRFRLRRATKDKYGGLIVRTSSDGILGLAASDPTLFDDPFAVPPSVVEQWVIGYVLNRVTHTFAEVSAARVVGKRGQRPPFRLKLADTIRIPHAAPLPPGFKPDQDDLDFPEEDEGLGEQGE
jgi:hypothetical protein